METTNPTIKSYVDQNYKCAEMIARRLRGINNFLLPPCNESDAGERKTTCMLAAMYQTQCMLEQALSEINLIEITLGMSVGLEKTELPREDGEYETICRR